MIKPLITIVSAVKNQETFIREMFSSVASQENINFEHIIIDGESTDSTMSILTKYQEENQTKYPIRIYTCPPKGVGDGMNQGIKHAIGDYILVLHGDDYLIDTKSTHRAEESIAKSKEASWITGSHTFIFHGHVFKRKMRKIFFTVLPFMNFIAHPNTLVKKELFDSIGNFKLDYKIAMDYELHMRFKSRKIVPFITDNSFVMFRKHKGGLSNSSKQKSLLRKELSEIKKKFWKSTL